MSTLRTCLVVSFVVASAAACDDVPHELRICPPGTSPAIFDCVLGVADTGAAPDVGNPDATDRPDGGADADRDTAVDVEPGDAGGPDIGPTDSGPTDIGPTDSGPDACVPRCNGRECGADGCGGVCGVCPAGTECSGRVCVGPEEGLSCADLLVCLQDCFDDACATDCADRASEFAIQLYTDAVDCVVENCSDLPDPEMADCQQNLCGAQIEACLSSDGTADQRCEQVLDCMLACSDDVCAQACYFNGTPDARAAIEMLFECGTEACSGTASLPELIDCSRGACPDAFERCVVAP